MQIKRIKSNFSTTATSRMEESGRRNKTETQQKQKPTSPGTDSSLVSHFKKEIRFCRSSVVDKVAVAVVERSLLKRS